MVESVESDLWFRMGFGVWCVAIFYMLVLFQDNFASFYSS